MLVAVSFGDGTDDAADISIPPDGPLLLLGSRIREFSRIGRSGEAPFYNTPLVEAQQGK
jgi:hypothetical protein